MSCGAVRLLHAVGTRPSVSCGAVRLLHVVSMQSSVSCGAVRLLHAVGTQCNITSFATVKYASSSQEYVSCDRFSPAVFFVAGTRFYIINKPKKEAALLYLKVPLCIMVWEGGEGEAGEGEAGKGE